MRWFFLQLFILNSVFASDLSELLKSFNGINETPEVSCTAESSSSEGAKLCAQPMLVCEDNKAINYTQMKYDLRASVSKKAEGDEFDRLNKIRLDEKVKLDPLINEMTQIRSELKSIPTFGRTYAQQVRFNDLNVKNQQLYNQYNQISKDVSLAELPLLDLNSKLEEKIFQKFSKTPDDLKKLFLSLKDTIKDQVKIEIQGTDKISADGLQKLITDKVDAIKLNTAATIANEVTYNGSAYLDTCGYDGLSPGAFYYAPTNSLIICPGLLLYLLSKNDGDLGALALTLSHEIGHSLDNGNIFSDSKGGATDQIKMSSNFDKFNACLKDNFVNDKKQKFGNFSESINQLENVGIPKLKSEIDKLENKKPLNLELLTDYKRALTTSGYYLEMFKQVAKEEEDDGGDPNFPNRVKRELSADYEAASATRIQLANTPEDKRVQVMKSMLGPLCPTETGKKLNEIVWGDISPASHPPDKFRIENFFRDDTIRSLLGCSPRSPGDKPWCSIYGAQ